MSVHGLLASASSASGATQHRVEGRQGRRDVRCWRSPTVVFGRQSRSIGKTAVRLGALLLGCGIGRDPSQA